MATLATASTSAAVSMLPQGLWGEFRMISRDAPMSRKGWPGQGVEDEGIELPGQSSLHAPQDLLAAVAHGGAFGRVGAAAWVVHEAVVGDRPQGAVGGAVTAAVQPVPGGLARGGLDRAGAADGSEGGLTVEPVGVVAGG